MTGPIRASEGRIDYLRFAFPANDAENGLALQESFEGLYNTLRQQFADWPGSFHKSRMYDGRGNWIQCFDVAGSLAHKWLYSMPMDWLANIVRIDVRSEVGAGLTSQQLDAIYETARGLNTRARNLTRKHARPRQKAEGRDAGGDLFACGSLKSDKYFAVYTKPNENTAFELKLSGKPLGVLLQAARQAERASNSASVPFGGADYLLTRLQNILKSHSREVTGNSAREWDELFARQDLEASNTGTMTLSERVCSLFDKLDEDERLLVLDTLISQTVGQPRDPSDGLLDPRD